VLSMLKIKSFRLNSNASCHRVVRAGTATDGGKFSSDSEAGAEEEGNSSGHCSDSEGDHGERGSREPGVLDW
jgi:hypothetical protein